MARTLRTGSLSFHSGFALAQGRLAGGSRFAGLVFGWSLFGCHLQEYLLETDAHRPELQQPPAARHDFARNLAADVAALLALDLERAGTGPHVRLRDAPDPR